eukprot:1073945-Ditylum_brightwellii.AAC.1
MPQSYQSHFDTLPSHIKRTLGNLKTQEVDVEYWLQALQENSVNIASDGSVIGKMGSYAVILHTEERELCLQGPCNCSTQCISSYRAELMGILAVYYLLHSFISFRDTPTELSASLYCDNISAVRSSNRNQLC